jgi:hypothetical protein
VNDIACVILQDAYDIKMSLRCMMNIAGMFSVRKPH